MGTQNFNDTITQQRSFFETGKTRSLDFRVDQLRRLRYAIKKHEQELFKALSDDLHKPKFEAYTSEIGHCYNEIDFTIKHLADWVKPTKVATDLLHLGAKSQVFHEPKGVVLIIGPFNYPFQLAITPLIASISAGNCSIVKPSELTPASSKIISKIVGEAFSPNFVTCIEGGVEETKALLNERFDHIFFTGGARVARIVMEAAAKHLTQVTLELGGKSPCIVDSTAPLDKTARRIIWGKFFNAGQTCVAPDYVLVHKSAKANLISELKKAIEEFYGKDAALSPDYGRIVNQRHFERLSKLIKGNIIYGGKGNEADRYIEPTLIEEPLLESPIMKEEIFGPILPILAFNEISQAIEIVHKNPYPLALYCFTNSSEFKEKILNEVQFGGGCINDTLIHLSSTHLPFGGVGSSGIGAYHGKAGFDLLSHHKSVVEKTNLFDIKLRYPPYNEGKLGIVRKFWK